ncbi:MAG TPA: hypothetical protein VH253_12755 [Phycisphaerae bacterium]|nr:hypothetical protein [Phycisphaerae bacterium]
MKKTQFPKGWDEARVQRLIRYYDQQTEDEELAEINAMFEPGEVLIAVPRKLAPQVRKLIKTRGRKPKPPVRKARRVA